MKYLLIGTSHGIGAALLERLGHENVHSLNHEDVDIPSDPFPEIEGNFDGLVYLPGTINLRPFDSIHEDQLRAEWEVNVLGAFRAIQAYKKQLNKGSSIVLMSTVAVKRGLPFHASTASAKAALEGMACSLAAEFAPRLRVNCVAPSLTETPLAEHLIDTDKKREASDKRHPLQRIGQPDEVAQAIEFLLTNGWVTGQTLHIDGGLSVLN